MITWEDTIMDNDALLGSYYDIASPLDKAILVAGLREIAQNQAEISFKAFMQEVVEWMKAKSWLVNPSNRSLFEDDWQAKLKEWGVK